MSGYDALVSLGEQCKSAYQLRRYSGTNASNIFDWLITPAASLLPLIATDFEGFFQIENLAVRPDGNGVEDRANGVIFQHGFPRDAAGNNTAAGIIAGYAEERSKIQHLLGHWRGLGRLRKILFCRSGEYDAGYPEQLLAALRKRFPASALTLLMVSEHQSPRVSGDGAIIEERVPGDAGPYPDLWKGDDAGWDVVLSQLLQSRNMNDEFKMSYFE